MQIEKTAQGKIKLWNKETGEMVERWPVDARGMLEHGEFSTEPVEVKRKKGEEQEGEQAPAPPPTSGVLVFDPIKTPSMDLVAGATSPAVPVEPSEAILGASTDVTALPSVETVGSGTVGASAATLPGTGALPRTTPLGAPAVHARSGTPAGKDQQPVRTTRGKGGK